MVKTETGRRLIQMSNKRVAIKCEKEFDTPNDNSFLDNVFDIDLIQELQRRGWEVNLSNKKVHKKRKTLTPILIKQALINNDGSITDAAKELCYSREHLSRVYNKMSRDGLIDMMVKDGKLIPIPMK